MLRYVVGYTVIGLAWAYALPSFVRFLREIRNDGWLKEHPLALREAFFVYRRLWIPNAIKRLFTRHPWLEKLT